ncbi:N-acetyllactosamine synthase [Aureococcus anophagefferens]|nr:N-acetyllactosamine synthase [Aureococcus anophagefferens]
MRKRVKDVLVFGFGSILLFGAYNVIRQNQRVIEQHADRARALEARLGRALEAEIELLKAEAEAEAEAARFKAGADAAAATCEAERVADAAAAERERLRAEQLQKLAFDRLQAEAAAATRTARSLEAGAAAAKKKIAQLQKDDAKKTLAEAQALESRRRSHRRMTAPLRDAPHRLAIVVPFRDDGGADKLSQGIGRSRNLDEFGKYMCAFVDVPFDVVVVEQSPDGAFNKGSLFNVGYQLTKASHDYMVLQDVDQVPERRDNAYAWRDEPTLLLGSTSQWQYGPSPNSNIVGGAFQISHAEYSDVGGYSNLFVGWGMEDHNMGWRVRKHMGYGKLDGPVGRYTALAHTRVMGLDLTEQYGRNAENAERDLSRGVDEIRFTALAETATPCGDECAGIATEALCASARAATALDSIFAAVAAHDRTGAKPGDVAAARDALAAIRADAGARRRCAWQEGRCVSKAACTALVRLDPPAPASR